jgi:hypothetical protein
MNLFISNSDRLRFAVKLLLFLGMGYLLFGQAHSWVYSHVRKPIMGVTHAALELAQQTNGYDRLILGDSVAHQFFNQRNQAHSRYAHLPTNAATTMVGQFILIMEHLKNNPLKEIILILHPYSLSDNINREYTANYVVGVYYQRPFRHYFTPYAEELVRNYRWWFLPLWLNRFPEFCTVNYQKVNPRPFPGKSGYISPVNLEYFVKLQHICRDQDITFRVLAPPIREDQLMLDYSLALSQIEAADLRDVFLTYFDFTYLPNDYFYDPLHVHWRLLDEVRFMLGIDWLKQSSLDGDRNDAS